MKIIISKLKTTLSKYVNKGSRDGKEINTKKVM